MASTPVFSFCTRLRSTFAGTDAMRREKVDERQLCVGGASPPLFQSSAIPSSRRRRLRRMSRRRRRANTPSL
eukprot:6173412-Pleurochrysis_carterae.AAC.1